MVQKFWKVQGSSPGRMGVFQLVVGLCIATSFAALSRETEAALRDFSKLRLENHKKSQQNGNVHSPKASNFHAESESTAATDDMEVFFKPSYPEISNSNGQQDGFGFGGQSQQQQNSNNNFDRNDNSDEGMGGFFSSPRNTGPNFSQRPLIGGPSLEEDIFSSVGMGVGPAGYSQSQSTFNSHGGDQNQKQEVSSNPNDEGDEEDLYFAPVRPSPDFLSQIDNEENSNFPQGFGGFSDGEEGDGEEEGYNHPGPPRHGHNQGGGQDHEGSTDDSNGEDGLNHGYGYGSNQGGGRGGPAGIGSSFNNNQLFNLYDYGDY